MKKSTKIISFFLSIVIIISVISIVSMQAESGDQFLNEDFESMAIEVAPSGKNWKTSGTGQDATATVETVSSKPNRALNISHLESVSSITAKLNIASTDSLTFSFDYKYDSVSAPGQGGTLIFLYNSDETVAPHGLRIAKADDNSTDQSKQTVMYYNGQSNTPVGFDVEKGAWYHFVLTVNGKSAKLSISSNGQDVFSVDNLSSEKAAKITKINLSNRSWATKDSFWFDNISVTSDGYAYTEDFETTELFSSPNSANWEMLYPSGYTESKTHVRVEKASVPYYTDINNKALYISDMSSKSGPVVAAYNFDPSQNITVEFDYMIATDDDFYGNAFFICNGLTTSANTKFGLSTAPISDSTQCTFRYLNKDGQYTNISNTNIDRHVWYNVKMVISSDKETATVYIDGTKAGDIWMNPNVASADMLAFMSTSSKRVGEKYYVDNVKISVKSIYSDIVTPFEDNFSLGIPSEYSLNGTGSGTVDGEALALKGEISADREIGYAKSGKFSFFVKTATPKMFSVELLSGTSRAMIMRPDENGRLYYYRGNLPVAINTDSLIKPNQWVKITIDLPLDRNCNYAYVSVNDTLVGTMLYNATFSYITALRIGCGEGATVLVKDVKGESSDGVIKLPDRTAKDPIVYLPEVIDSEVIYLANDKTPKSSTLAPIGNISFNIDTENTSFGVDLGSKQKINAIRVNTALTEEAELQHQGIEIYSSDDNRSWTQLNGFTYNHLEENGKWVSLFEFSGVEAQYVKIRFAYGTKDLIPVDSPTENIRAERRTVRQWKMAGQVMWLENDADPLHGSMINRFVDNELVLVKDGSVGINFGLNSAVEAIELVGRGFDELTHDNIKVYYSNDNIRYYPIDKTVVSYGERDGKNTLRYTFDSIVCGYIKLFAEKDVNISLDNLYDGLCAYSSVESASYKNQLTSNRAAEGDFVFLPDGTMILAYHGYGDSVTDFDHTDLVAVSSIDGGITWSKPWTLLVKEKGSVNVIHPRFLWLGDGTLGLYYGEKKADENTAHLYFTKSYDNGRNWEDPILITALYDGYYNFNSSGNCVTRLPNGRILFTTSSAEYTNDVYGEPHCKVVVWYSDDQGSTWQKSETSVVLPNAASSSSIAMLENGNLLMIMRTRGQGKIFHTISTDNGNTWAQPEAIADLVTPSATVSIVEIPATKDILLAWNNEFALDNGERKPLTTAVSADHGLTFKNIKNVYEAKAQWPHVEFYGRTALIMHGGATTLRMADVEEFYYTTSGVNTLDSLPTANTPAATYENGWLNGVSYTTTYSVDGGNTWNFCGGSSVRIGEGCGEILVKDIGDHKHAPSAIQTIK